MRLTKFTVLFSVSLLTVLGLASCEYKPEPAPLTEPQQGDIVPTDRTLTEATDSEAFKSIEAKLAELQAQIANPPPSAPDQATQDSLKALQDEVTKLQALLEEMKKDPPDTTEAPPAKEGDDKTPPKVSSTTPKDGRTDVKPGLQKLLVKFSEKVEVSDNQGCMSFDGRSASKSGRTYYYYASMFGGINDTIKKDIKMNQKAMSDAANIIIRAAYAIEVESIDSASNPTIVFALDKPIGENSHYKVTLKKDCVKDLKGNKMAEDYEWSFTTSKADTGGTDAAPPAGGSTPFKVESETTELEQVGGPGGTKFDISCAAGQVIAALKIKSGNQLDNIGIGCRDINTLDQAGSPTMKYPVSGGAGGSWAVETAPLLYAFTGWSTKTCDYGSHKVIAEFIPHARNTRQFSNPLWEGGRYGEGSNGSSGCTNWESRECDSGSVLTGLKGGASDRVDALIGVCSKVTGPSDQWKSFTLGETSDLPKVGGDGGTAFSFSCTTGGTGLVVTLVTVKSGNQIDSIGFGCKDLNQLNTDTKASPMFYAPGGSGGSDWTPAHAPKEYALVGWKTKTCDYGPHRVIAEFVPVFRYIVNPETPEVSGQKFGEGSNESGGCTDWETSLCTKGQVLTTVSGGAGSRIDSLGGKCQEVK